MEKKTVIRQRILNIAASVLLATSLVPIGALEAYAGEADGEEDAAALEDFDYATIEVPVDGEATARVIVKVPEDEAAAGGDGVAKPEDAASTTQDAGGLENASAGEKAGRDDSGHEDPVDAMPGSTAGEIPDEISAEPVVERIGNVYVLEYGSEDEAAEAVARLDATCEFAEIDAEIVAAGEASAQTGSGLAEEAGGNAATSGEMEDGTPDLGQKHDVELGRIDISGIAGILDMPAAANDNEPDSPDSDDGPTLPDSEGILLSPFDGMGKTDAGSPADENADGIECRPARVALVDSGAPEGAAEVFGAISVIGDDASDESGHAAAVLSHLLLQAPDCAVYSVRVLDKENRGTVASVYAGIEAAIEEGVDIINLSLCGKAGEKSKAIADAVADARKAGIVVVAAAGNEGEDVSGYVPAGLADAITAGSCDDGGTRIQKSSRGGGVDVWVVSESTSYAAAITSGWLASNSDLEDPRGDLAAACGNGLFFSSASEPKAEEPAADEGPEETLPAKPENEAEEAPGESEESPAEEGSDHDPEIGGEDRLPAPDDVMEAAASPLTATTTELRSTAGVDRTASKVPSQTINWSVDGLDPSKAVFSTTDRNSFKFGRLRVFSPTAGVYLTMPCVYTPNDKTATTWEPSGTFTLKWTDVARDVDGNKLDFELTGSQVRLHHSTAGAKLANSIVLVKYTADSSGNDVLWVAADGSCDGEENTAGVGVRVKLTGKFTITGTSTPANGRFLMEMTDIDQPDSSDGWAAASYDKPYAESVMLGDSFEDTVYCQSRIPSTDPGTNPDPGPSLLRIDEAARKISGSEGHVFEDQFRTGFVARSSGPSFSLTWRGSACATVLMQSYRGIGIWDKNNDATAGVTDQGIIAKTVDANGARNEAGARKAFNSSTNHGGKRTRTTWRKTSMPWRGSAEYLITAKPGYRVSKIEVRAQSTPTSAWTTVATIKGKRDVSGTLTFRESDNDGSDMTWKTSRNYQIIVTTAKVDDASAVIRGTKILENGTLAGSDFSFGLYTNESCTKALQLDPDGYIVASGGTALTVRNAADGSVVFPTIKYRYSGNPDDYTGGRTSTYYLKENAGSDTERLTYDKTVRAITATESYDAGTGRLSVALSGNNPIFTNSYKKLGGISATKTDAQTGAPLPGATFTVYRMPDSTDLSALTYDAVKAAGTKATVMTSTSDGIAKTSATELPADGAKYAVIETAAPTGYKVNTSWVGTATLVQDGAIAAVTGVSGAGSDACADTPSSGSATIRARKQLEGRALRAGEFEFLLEAVTPGAPMPGEAVATNDANGIVTWPSIEYASAGTYVYRISEIQGAEDPQMAWDNTSHLVAVTVANAGGIRTAVTYDTTESGTGGTSASPAFINVFEPRCGIRITKVDSTTGDPLAGADFEIVGIDPDALLYDADGNRVPSLTITSGEDGIAATPKQRRAVGEGGLEEVDGALVTGKRYTIRETKAPVGYSIDGGFAMPFTAGAGTSITPIRSLVGFWLTEASADAEPDKSEEGAYDSEGKEGAEPENPTALAADTMIARRVLRAATKDLSKELEADMPSPEREATVGNAGIYATDTGESAAQEPSAWPLYVHDEATTGTVNPADSEITAETQGSEAGAGTIPDGQAASLRHAGIALQTLAASIAPTYYDLANGTYLIRDAASTGYVVAATGSASEGRAVSSKAYNASSRLQQWRISKVTDVGSNDNTYKVLCAADTAYGLAVDSGTQANGTKLELSDYKGYRYHKFFIDKNANSSASFFPCFASPSHCMDITDAAYNGGRMQIWEAQRNSGDSFGTRNTSQQFTLERVYYNVKFNGNGSTSGSMPNQKIWMDKATALAANGFARTGYSFSGWATSASRANAGTVDYGPGASVTNLTTTHQGTYNLYAVWTPCTMTLRYNVNGGAIATSTSDTTRYRASSGLVQRSTDSGATWKTIETELKTTDTFLNLWNVGTFGAAKTGYHIDGSKAYNTRANGMGVNLNQNNTASTDVNPVTTSRINGGTQITGDTAVTLYVNWIANTYSVRYNGNGSTSGSMPDSTHVYNAAKALTANGFSRTGHVFAGWATSAADAESGAVTYADGQSVTNLTSANNATVDLYAAWTPAAYTIAYANMDDAAFGASHPTSATYDMPFTVDAPTHGGGKAFLGWDISGMDDSEHVIGGETTTDQSASNVIATSFKNLRGSTGTVVFTAVWEGEYPPDGGLYDLGVFRDSPLATSVTISGRKWLREKTGRDGMTERALNAGDFSFELVGPDGNVMGTATNDASGSFAFDPIRYDHTDIGHSYVYTVREVNSGADGMEYDEAECHVTVRPYLGSLSGKMQLHQQYDKPVCCFFVWDDPYGDTVFAEGRGASNEGALVEARNDLRTQTDDGSGYYSIDSSLPAQPSGTLRAYWYDYTNGAYDYDNYLEMDYEYGGGITMTDQLTAAFENIYTPSYDAEIAKADADDPSSGIAGAIFTVYEWNGSTATNGEVPIPPTFSNRSAFDSIFSYDAPKRSLSTDAAALSAAGLLPIATIVTDVSGRGATAGGALAAGKTYFVVETTAPPGYELAGYSDRAPQVNVGVLRDYTDAGGLPCNDTAYTAPSSGGQVALGHMISIGATSAEASPLEALVWTDVRTDEPLGGIRVTKVDAGDMETGLADAWFGIYAEDAFSAAYADWKRNNPSAPDAEFLGAVETPEAGDGAPNPLYLEPLAEIRTDSAGVAQTAASELAVGTRYRVVEIEAPDGYRLPSYDFARPNASGSGNMTIEVVTAHVHETENTDGEDAVFPDTPYDLSGQASLHAVKMLDGARLAASRFSFQLLDENGTVLQEKQNAAPASSGQAGMVAFDPISYGPSDMGLHTYYVREVIPDGVIGIDGRGEQVATWATATDEQKNDDEISWRKYEGESYTAFDVSRHKITVTVRDEGTGELGCEIRGNGPAFYNEAYSPRAGDIYGGVKVKKVAANTGEPLHGAIFRIEDLDTGRIWDLPATGDDGCSATGERVLPAGSYKVYELEPPEGYKLNENWSIRFSVEADGDYLDFSEGAHANPCKDTPDAGPVLLPMTGGNGIALVSVASCAAIALGLALRRRPE